MKKKVSFILLTALLFLLVSCGIPSIYVPSDDDIVIKEDASVDGKFTVTLSKTVFDEMASGFPYIYFFYTISSSGQQNRYSTAISNFNTKYCDQTAGSPIPTTPGSEPVASASNSSDSSHPYGIYQFENLISYGISGSRTTTFVFKNTDGILSLSDESGNILVSSVTRYNAHTFTKDEITDHHSEIVDYSSTGQYTVKIYALVSCQFDDYSNIYNTKLSESTPVFDFLITL